MFALLSLDDSPYSKLEMFMLGIAALVVLLVVYKFLAKGNRDNLDEIPEVPEEDRQPSTGDVHGDIKTL